MEWSESHIISAALALGANQVAGWTSTEHLLTKNLPSISSSIINDLRKQIITGGDPLGEHFCKIRSTTERRKQGATYTPLEIVKAMVAWGMKQGEPVRVVDAGAGSARFLLEAGRQLTNAELIGCELDPVAAIIARGNLASLNFADRARIIVGDYRELKLPTVSGATFYVGNPPYVRHHLIGNKWKRWLVCNASSLGLKASQLAGLHVYFFLKTVLQGQRGDFGSFITAAEWLDVNYGSIVRDLFLSDLGGQQIVVMDPTAMPFPDTATTAVITFFQIGSQPKSVRFKRIKSPKELSTLNKCQIIGRKKLEIESRWSRLTKAPRPLCDGFIELGELFRVHRGQVTGANKIWIAGNHSEGLPSSVLYPSITKARELISAGLVLDSVSRLRRVIDIPTDLSSFDHAELRAIEAFLRLAKTLGGDDSFIARNRKAWWSVGLRQPAPILASYMARRPPAFVRNKAQARHINIAHGLYPREPMEDYALDRIVQYLSTKTSVADGRTYAGGLTKFEPKEMERILIPSPHALGI